MLKLPRTGNAKLDKALEDMENASADVDRHWAKCKPTPAVAAPAKTVRYKRVRKLNRFMPLTAFIIPGGDE